jgi:RNA polymerase sigma-70 factor (ECF subfamily)
VFSANLAHDQFKASHAEKRGGAAKFSAQDTEGLVTTQSHAAEIERKLILGQVSACLKTVASGPNANRDCQIFWLYYRVGLSASAIAAFPTFGLGVKGVESTILRLTRAVRQKLAPEKRTIGAKKPFEGIRETESL